MFNKILKIILVFIACAFGVMVIINIFDDILFVALFSGILGAVTGQATLNIFEK